MAFGSIGKAIGGLFGGGGSSARRSIRQAQEAEQAGLQAGIDEQRRQFDSTREMLMPFIESGTGMLGGLGESATLGGFASNLDAIMGSGELDPLRAQRRGAIDSAFGASGMLNSGARSQAIADDLTDFSLGIEGLLNQRQGGLMDAGMRTAGGLAGFGQQNAAIIGDLESRIGQSKASSILGQQQQRMQSQNQLLSTLGGIGGGALMGAGGMMGGLGAAGGAGLGLLFSDSRLKENIQKTGSVGPLNLYRWDWVPELDALGIKPTMKQGFLAEEVEAVFPEFVHPVGRFKAVDYQGVIDRLEEVLH